MVVASPMRTMRSLTLGATVTAMLAVASLATALVAIPSAAIPSATAASLLEGKLLHALDLDPRNVAADQLDDGYDELAVIGRAQGEGATLAAGAAGAADAMDIVLGVYRHIEIEHMAHADDVEAAGRDVAGDQQRDLALLEFLQRLGALRLRHVAMDRGGVETMAMQRLVEDVHVALAVAEDNGVLHLLGADQSAQRLALLHLVDHSQTLGDQGRRRSRRRHGDLFRI